MRDDRLSVIVIRNRSRSRQRVLQEAGQAMQTWPKGYGFLTDQLKRAGASIVLNIAEGNGRFGVAERRQFLRIAKGSAAECAACLDVAAAYSLLPADVIKAMKNLLHRVICMLSRMH